jgi:tetratricopeptide (TPR) repeat protein
MKTWIVVVAIAIGGCKKSKTEPVTVASGSQVVAAVVDALAAADAAPVAAWQLQSKPVEIDCAPAAPAGSYKASLDAGRAAGKAKKWAEAVAQLEHALAVQKGDPAALSELAWATLQTGDAKRSLELAEQAIAVATTPAAQAASHFNAARAAEALGDADGARKHYEKSLELRPNDAIKERLANLQLAQPRRLPTGASLTACQNQASVDAVCKCLATSVAEWGKAGGIEGKVTCEAAPEHGALGALVVVQEQPADPDAAVGGSAFVLVAKRGETWSPLQVVERADGIDLTVTPKATHTAKITAYEERGTTIWVESQNQFSETGGGEREVRGEAGVTTCDVGAPGSCAARIPIATWDYTQTLAHGDGEDQCDVRSLSAFRATLTSANALTLVLAAGSDDGGRAGRYQR